MSKIFAEKQSLSTTSRVLALAASADLIFGRDTSAVASWGDRIPMDALTGNVCRLSRVEAYAVTSSAGRYTALFKAVLCGWGEIVGQGYTSRSGTRASSSCSTQKSIIRSVKVSTRILIIEVARRLVGENKRMSLASALAIATRCCSHRAARHAIVACLTQLYVLVAILWKVDHHFMICVG
jgi:hypothetical protein